MENKAHALAAGIFVVAITALLVALAAWLTRDTGERDIYEISTRETVTGLQSQAAVRYRGVDVGKVASIGFDPKTPGNVLMRLEVDREAPVTRETFATLGYQGVTGLAFVQLDDSGQPAPRLTPDNGNPPRIPLKPSLLSKLTARGEVILDEVEKVAKSLDQMLGEANQTPRRHGAGQPGQRCGRTPASWRKRLDATVDKRLDPTLDEIAATMRSVKKDADEVGKAAADFGNTARRLNEKDGPMDRLAEGTEALSHAADSFNAATLPRINRVTEDTSRAVRQLGRTRQQHQRQPAVADLRLGPIDPGPGEPGFAAPGARK